LILGASTFPSTNNALESNNKQIKESHSLRERLPFDRFVVWAEKMVSFDWSTSRQVPSEVQAKIMPHLYVSARQLHNSGRQVFVLRKDERFAITSSKMPGLDSRQVKHVSNLLYNGSFASFEDFSETRFKVCFNH